MSWSDLSMVRVSDASSHVQPYPFDYDDLTQIGWKVGEAKEIVALCRERLERYQALCMKEAVLDHKRSMSYAQDVARRVGNTQDQENLLLSLHETLAGAERKVRELETQERAMYKAIDMALDLHASERKKMLT